MSSHIYLAGQRPTNWGHHFYHSKMDGDLSHGRQIHTQTQKSPSAYGLTSFSEKTRKSYHLQLLEQIKAAPSPQLFKDPARVLVQPGIEPELLAR